MAPFLVSLLSPCLHGENACRDTKYECEYRVTKGKPTNSVGTFLAKRRGQITRHGIEPSALQRPALNLPESRVPAPRRCTPPSSWRFRSRFWPGGDYRCCAGGVAGRYRACRCLRGVDDYLKAGHWRFSVRPGCEPGPGPAFSVFSGGVFSGAAVGGPPAVARRVQSRPRSCAPVAAG